MNIKTFPPIGTLPSKQKSDSEENKPSANQQFTAHSVSKDEFEAAKKNTIDQLLSKSKTQDLLSLKAQQLAPFKEPPLQPAGDCDPATRIELAGSCIPMGKLEPVGDCEPMTRMIDRLKQQPPIRIEKRLTKPEK